MTSTVCIDTMVPSVRQAYIEAILKMSSKTGDFIFQDFHDLAHSAMETSDVKV